MKLITNKRVSQGVSEKLGTLIEGESLLNDGSAIVVFEVFIGQWHSLVLVSVGQFLLFSFVRWFLLVVVFVGSCFFFID